MNFEIINCMNYQEVFKNINNNMVSNLIIYENGGIDQLDEISWMWSTNFHELSDIEKIFCCGKRNKDIFLKLKLDNLADNIYVEEDILSLVDNIKGMNENFKIIGNEHSINEITSIFDIKKR